jgi:S-adenosylmethionine hydrolase
MGRIITLTSDFGCADEFVGVMKGVILGLAPGVRIVDLSHQIAAYDVRQAAFLLGSAHRFFQAGTVHLAVVDPGVGSARRIVLVEAGGQLFLAPDNGLLSLVLIEADAARIWQVDNRELFLAEVSATFHGRDILAPVAARLAGGLEPDRVGPPLAPADLVHLTDLLPMIDRRLGVVVGRIEQVDHFGNLITNISGRLLTEIFGPGLTRLKVSCGGREIRGLSTTFSGVATGAVAALVGGRGYLELAVNQGRADWRLAGRAGVPVSVRKD